MNTLSQKPQTFADIQAFTSSPDTLSPELQKVANLDFTMLKRKLVQENGWAPDFCDEAEDLYKKFLALNLHYPDRKICPTGPIDTFWHAHILDTRAYTQDCEALFGHYLHHFPYFGMRGTADAADLKATFQESIELFIIHFGIDPTCGDMESRSCSVQNCP
jgi:hypothetical protein